MRTAITLFDFSGCEGVNSEDLLMFEAGDRIKVQDVSNDGWASGANGEKSGIFPVSYVTFDLDVNQPMPSPPVSPTTQINYVPTRQSVLYNPPPPPPPEFKKPMNYTTETETVIELVESKNDTNDTKETVSTSTVTSTSSQQGLPRVFTPVFMPTPAQTPPPPPPHELANQAPPITSIPDEVQGGESLGLFPGSRFTSIYKARSDIVSTTNKSIFTMEDVATEVQISKPRSARSLSKSWNPFQTFVTTGAEDYLLHGQSLDASMRSEPIVIDGSVPKWSEIADRYDFVIPQHARKSKLKGLKKFWAFEIVNQAALQSVWRRYKHFEWLYECLCAKFSTLPLPPIPPRRSYLSEASLTETRKSLETWLRRLERNIVVRNSSVFQHFISCPDDKAMWKAGKRRAERDPIKGSMWLANIVITTPTKIDEHGDPETIEKFSAHIEEMDKYIEKLENASRKFANEIPNMRHQYECFAHALDILSRGDIRKNNNASVNSDGMWTWRSTCDESSKLTHAMRSTVGAFKIIGSDFEREMEEAFTPFLRDLSEYHGLISVMETSIAIHQATQKKTRHAHRYHVDGRMSLEKYQELSARATILFNVCLSEINRFHDEKIQDFTKLMVDFLKKLVGIHHKVAIDLEDSLKLYLPPM